MRTSISRAIEAATNRAVIYSSTARAKFLKELANQYAEAARAASAYFRGTFDNYGPQRGSAPFGSPAGFYGLMSAVFHNNPGLMPGGLDAEVQAFAQQREELNGFRQDVEARFRALKNDADQWQTSTVDAATKLLKANEKRFEDLHNEQSTTFQQSAGGWERKFADLEALCREKLRLEEPAKYWKNLEEQYIREGRLWTAGSAAVILALATWVTYLVYRPPEVLTSDKFTLGGFKGTILIAAGISAFPNIMNLSVKVATSSYHLARDARERFQLTHVFLALIKDGAIEVKDREVILSALFSRSDTGLLKGDSSSTLPTPLGSIIESPRK